MYISLTNRNGFKSWADAHRPSNRDEDPAGETVGQAL